MNLGDLKSSKTSPATGSRNTDRNPSTDIEITMNLGTRQETAPVRTRYSSASFREPVQVVPQKKKRAKNPFTFLRAHKIMSFFLILIVLGGSFYFAKLSELKKTGLSLGILDPLKTAISVVSAPNETAVSKLDKTNGRTNFVVIGVDARSYNDSYLTDSIMLLSYDHATNQMAQISFPRDLEAKYRINNRYYDTKINSVFPFTYSETKSFDEAFKNLGKALEDISGQPVHYGMMINFRGFKEIIDTLGGVTIDVERSFTDYTYPNDNDTGVITVSFSKGVQTMNGTKALQFARSRHSMDNGEGSDFMRARRQQKVMLAIKEKFINSNMFGKADSINQIISTLGNNIKFYNIGGDDIDIAVKARDILKDVKTYSMVVDPSLGSFTNQLLIGGDKGGSLGYAVTPNNAKDYSEVTSLIEFYMDNPYLLEEKAEVRVAWTNSKRYNDYVKLKQSFWDLKLPFEFNDSRVVVADTTVTTTPTPSTTKAPFTGTIYVLNPGKDKTVEFYKKTFGEDSMNFTVKQGTELPKELEKLRPNTDVLMVVD